MDVEGLRDRAEIEAWANRPPPSRVSHHFQVAGVERARCIQDARISSAASPTTMLANARTAKSRPRRPRSGDEQVCAFVAEVDLLGCCPVLVPRGCAYFSRGRLRSNADVVGQSEGKARCCA